MRRGSWVATAAAIVVAATATPAQACDCAPLTPSEAVAGADFVFVGTASRQLGPKPDEGSPDPVSYAFRVERVVKGDVKASISVQTNNSSDACGVDFQIGDRYEVYALDADGTPFATQCGGTHRIS
ncbi:hypothetical protein [Cryptosporangium sp. NPDC048952]|uniref:hypothetical protein n=1 Tax=Cryptosporangium sp. NPDC048952 TaxID=3363961 RepID=UPI00371A1B58